MTERADPAAAPHRAPCRLRDAAIMNETTVIEIGRQAVITLLTVGSPVMLIALGVGLIISLFQALTQIQEMTLVFVPKILVIFISLLILLPFMLGSLLRFGRALFDMIISMGASP